MRAILGTMMAGLLVAALGCSHGESASNRSGRGNGAIPPPATASAEQGMTRPSLLIPASGPAAATEPDRPFGESLARWARRIDLESWRAAERLWADAMVRGLASALADPLPCMQRGDACLAQKDYPAARRCFQRAVSLAPRNADALKGLAVALVADRAYNEAIGVYQRILELIPADRAALFNLAVAYSRVELWAESRAAYRRLLEADPKDVPRVVQPRHAAPGQWRTGGRP